MLDVGPDAPTLCGDWTVRDLAAHLVIRERRPDGAAGLMIRPLAGYGDKVRRHEAERDFDELVERVRTGPPSFSPTKVAAIDRAINTVEFFVHHEDVRRAREGWEPRALDADLEGDLHGPFSKLVRLTGRRSPVGLRLEPEGFSAIVAKRSDEGAPSVTVRGSLGEIVLFMYGRQEHSRVDLDGPDDAVDQVRTTKFGI